MKIAYLVVTAALFTTGVAKTTEKISARAERVIAPAAWSAKDPADSLYREARAALGKGDYAKAAELFRKITRQYPNSDYAGEALYYLAFSEYRLGGSDRLRSALQSLTRIENNYPDLAKRSDARALRTRVCGELAKQGDEACAADIARSVSSAVSTASLIQGVGAAVSASVADAVSGAVADAVAGSVDQAVEQEAREYLAKQLDSRRTRSGCPSEDDDDDERIAALNALIQMDADRAMPILTKVLERRDPCSVGLRRKAVFPRLAEANP